MPAEAEIPPMWLRHIRRCPAAARLIPVRPQAGNLPTVLICVAALVFYAGPAVASAFATFAGAPLTEELPTETCTRPESLHRAGVRPCAGNVFGKRIAGRGVAVGSRIVSDRRPPRALVFIPSPATELIRTGIRLLC